MRAVHINKEKAVAVTDFLGCLQKARAAEANGDIAIAKIDINDPSEVEYVHQKFPYLKHDQVVKAIKEKGPSREMVMQ